MRFFPVTAHVEGICRHMVIGRRRLEWLLKRTRLMISKKRIRAPHRLMKAPLRLKTTLLRLLDEQVFVKCAEGILWITDMDLDHPDVRRGMEGNLV